MSEPIISNKENDDFREREIGFLYLKQGPKGQFYSGKIEYGDIDIPIVCFVNRKKREEISSGNLRAEKWPDLHIFKSKPMPSRDNAAKQSSEPKDSTVDI